MSYPDLFTEKTTSLHHLVTVHGLISTSLAVLSSNSPSTSTFALCSLQFGLVLGCLTSNPFISSYEELVAHAIRWITTYISKYNDKYIQSDLGFFVCMSRTSKSHGVLSKALLLQRRGRCYKLTVALKSLYFDTLLTPYLIPIKALKACLKEHLRHFINAVSNTNKGAQGTP
ncbi:hypothetical protein DVH24_005621 [Malus domestica]|uniref:Uncharacterized protein n=1 Tax=Malus domestica TaxID=3750 RepID=A0A498IIH2_MALDO|nr:hypothetical protein DVH24_005621 [Malus domestica]